MPKIDYTNRGEILRAARSREGGSSLATELTRKMDRTMRDAAIENFESFNPQLIDRWTTQSYIAVYEPDAFQWIPDFEPGPYFMFFDDPTDTVFKFEKPWQFLVTMKRAFPKDTYYLTDEQANYLIAIDEHRILYGLGSAETWIRHCMNRIFRLLSLENCTECLQVTQVNMNQFGRSLCLRMAYQHTKPFDLILQDCATIQWRNSTNHPPENSVVDYVYMQEVDTNRHRISIVARDFRLYTYCESVKIEKRW